MSQRHGAHSHRTHHRLRSCHARRNPPTQRASLPLFAIACTPWFGADVTDPVLRLFCEARLDEVPIECKGPPDAQLLHDEKGNAIREGVIFILMALEIRPSFVK
jgi:hypothetical protein